MNKKYQQFVPICFILVVILTIVGIVTIVKPKIEEYFTVKAKVERNNIQRRKLEEQIRKEENEKQAQEIKLRALKPIYKSSISSDGNESLSVFGTMFEDIIKMARSNGLLIRSIEYNMNPSNDPLLSASAGIYNACELKFFFVGTYVQLREFINDLTQNFEYLISVSGLNIQAFSENTDYILISQSITLYSEKPPKKVKNRR